VKYFSHDSNAHMDAKLDKVLMHYGAKGYAIYWYCLELIVGKLETGNVTFRLEHDEEQIGARLKIDSREVTGILDYMVDIGLFERSGSHLTCLKVLSRLQQSATGSKQIRALIAEYRDQKKPETIMTPPQDVMTHHDEIMTPHDDVMICHAKQDKTKQDKTKRENTLSTLPQAEDAPAAVKRVNYQEIIDLYHEMLPNHPRVKVLTESRKRHIKKLATNNLPDLEHWRKFFNAITRSDFLSGRVEPRDGRRPFIADLDFLINPNKYVKILEGKYHE